MQNGRGRRWGKKSLVLIAAEVGKRKPTKQIWQKQGDESGTVLVGRVATG
jgi:hypothetical protein